MKIEKVSILSLILACVFSCSEKNLSSLSSTITISSEEKGILESNLFIDRIDTLSLKSRGSFFSSIQAACVTDSNLYIVDKMGTIGKFNIHSGLLDKKISKVGHGSEEYINPVSLCENNGKIFVLDFQGCAVIVYDLLLNYEKKIRLGFPALDFVKVPTGFLFYNMNASVELRQIVYTNEEGQIFHILSSPFLVIRGLYMECMRKWLRMLMRMGLLCW